MQNYKKNILKTPFVIITVILTVLTSFLFLTQSVLASEDRPWTENFPYQMPDGYDKGKMSHIVNVIEKVVVIDNVKMYHVTVTINTNVATGGIDILGEGQIYISPTCDYKPSDNLYYKKYTKNDIVDDTLVISFEKLVNPKTTKYFLFTIRNKEMDNTATPPKEVFLEYGYVWDLDTGEPLEESSDDGNIHPGLSETDDIGGIFDPPVISEEIQIASLKPHIIVESYAFGSNTLTAGQTFTLEFTLKNTSEIIDVQNILVVLTPSDDLSIRSGANTFHIKEIKKKSSATYSVDLKLKVNAEVQVQKLNIKSTFEYFDKKDTDPVSGEDTIDISMSSGKITRAKVANIDVSKKFKQKEDGSFIYSVVNNGFSVVHNVEVFVYDKNDKELAWQFIGNLEAGSKSETPKIILNFVESGEQELYLLVRYEDDNLVVKELTKDFTLPVEAVEESIVDEGFGELPPIIDEGEFGEEDPEGELGWPGWLQLTTIQKVLIGAGGLVLILIIIAIIRAIVKRKNEKFDDFFEAFPSAVSDDKKKKQK